VGDSRGVIDLPETSLAQDGRGRAWSRPAWSRGELGAESLVEDAASELGGVEGWRGLSRDGGWRSGEEGSERGEDGG
jgi:hypothetical protein